MLDKKETEDISSMHEIGIRQKRVLGNLIASEAERAIQSSVVQRLGKIKRKKKKTPIILYRGFGSLAWTDEDVLQISAQYFKGQ